MRKHSILSISALFLLLSTPYAKAQTPSDSTAVKQQETMIEEEEPKQEEKKAKKIISNVAEHIKLHGYAQAGYTYKKCGGNSTNTFDLKRTLLWANAQIIDRWSFLFMHDFNSQVQEFYTDFRITRNNALSVRFGQFKNAYTLENPLSPTAMETIDVYSEGVTFLSGCGSDPLFGVQYGRDLGLSLFGETNDQKLRYELQVMNGQGINRKDKNKNKDLILRLEWRPVKGLNIVASSQLGKGHAVDSSVYNPDIQLNEDYTRNRYSAGLSYNSKAFNIHGEFLQGRDGDAVSIGGYVTGSVAIIPTKLDLIASYDFFNFNRDLDMDQHKGVFGIQYWFYQKCRVQLQYVYKSAYATATEFVHDDNHALMCQVQFRFN
ncbi:MAG: OprO/OprP family phosphate-selective porin [Paludibacteraceae bacterium]|nr:OprO/OprP family phosphate-selective porin [Paludibacteraceae bacterium]